MKRGKAETDDGNATVRVTLWEAGVGLVAEIDLSVVALANLCVADVVVEHGVALVEVGIEGVGGDDITWVERGGVGGALAGRLCAHDSSLVMDRDDERERLNTNVTKKSSQIDKKRRQFTTDPGHPNLRSALFGTLPLADTPVLLPHRSHHLQPSAPK